MFDQRGWAIKEFNWGHSHGAGDPHAHDWDWTKPRVDVRGPPRPIRPGELSSPWSPMTALYRLLASLTQMPLMIMVPPGNPCIYNPYSPACRAM
jgi:hypothetical protein